METTLKKIYLLSGEDMNMICRILVKKFEISNFKTFYQILCTPPEYALFMFSKYNKILTRGIRWDQRIDTFITIILNEMPKLELIKSFEIFITSSEFRIATKSSNTTFRSSQNIFCGFSS